MHCIRRPLSNAFFERLDRISRHARHGLRNAHADARFNCFWRQLQGALVRRDGGDILLIPHLE